MCGIGGFSLSAGSKINPKVLTNVLLTQLESRGGMASGFAYQTGNENGLFKAPVNGAGLSLKSMPKGARNVIVHTRLATHGSVNDNRNNHPVVSPYGEIALVHNGVIYNHNTVRMNLDANIDFDVDTAVIPALIEEDRSLQRLVELDGDAAIAWFDDQKDNVLHLARLAWSPMCVAQVEDGSLIFTSTESIMWNVLIQLDLTPTYLEDVKEYTYFQVREGIISHWEELPEPKHTSRYNYDYTYYRHQTAGGKVYYDDPFTGVTHIGGDLYDDDDIEDWNDSFRSNSVSELSETLHPSPYYFYIKTRERGLEDTTWYHDDEYGEFKNDIWYLQKEYPSLVIDYGRLIWDTGEMVTYLNPNNERHDVAQLKLTI